MLSPLAALRVYSAKHLQLFPMDGKCRFFAALRMTPQQVFLLFRLYDTRAITHILGIMKPDKSP